MRRARAHPSRGGRRVRSSRRAGSARAAPGLWRRARLRACRALRASRAGPRARRRRAAGRARERAGAPPRARPARHPRARRDRNVRPGCRVHPRHARARRRFPPSRAPRATARGGAVRRAPRGKSRGTGTPVAARARGHPENRCRRDRAREPRRHPRRAAPRAAGGDRPATPRARQWGGVLCALAGRVGLLLPGLSAPPLAGATLMLGAGVAWGVYSLRGKGAGDPTRVTAGNFLRAVPLSAALSLAMLPAGSIDAAGAVYAVTSGALASGVGYALWYAALKHLPTTTAATIQLSVPVIAAAGGIVFLGEALTLRLITASAVILGGIALAILGAPRR